MTKKRIIITGLTILIALGIAALVLSNREIRESLPVRLPLPTGQQPRGQFIIPQGETTKVSNIEVKNFIKEARIINDNNDMVFAETQNYEIIFFPQGDYFLISILASPFSRIRTEAEQAFLAKLGISEKEACQLKVSISTPNFANPQESGETYKLSFCQ